MIKELKLTKRRKLLGAVVICVVLITGSTILWQMGQVAEAAILDPHPGLVGWWRFDEGEGSAAEDSSGFGNHGTVYGATWVEGKHGKALGFDGVDDYVGVLDDDTLDIPDGLTVEVWVKVGALTATFQTIVEKNWNVLTSSWILQINSADYLEFYVKTADGLENAYWSTAPTLDVWYHVVGVYDGANVKLYVNGSLKDSSTLIGSIGANANPVWIGQSKNKGNPINGAIDEVRIYNQALSAAEIQEIFQKGPDFSSRLLAKVPKGTTQFISTLSWQGDGSIGVTIESPSKTYTEDMVPVYQKTVYSSDSGDMLNIKRVVLSVAALSSDEDWYVVLEFDDVEDYRITVEVQK